MSGRERVVRRGVSGRGVAALVSPRLASPPGAPLPSYTPGAAAGKAETLFPAYPVGDCQNEHGARPTKGRLSSSAQMACSRSRRRLISNDFQQPLTSTRRASRPPPSLPSL